MAAATDSMAPSSSATPGSSLSSTAWARSLSSFLDRGGVPRQATGGSEAGSSGRAAAGGVAATAGGGGGVGGAAAAGRGSASPARTRDGVAAPAAAGSRVGSRLLAGDVDTRPLEDRVLDALRRLMDDDDAAQPQLQQQRDSDAAAIPVFFRKKPPADSIASRVQHCAKYKFLQKQKEGLLDQQELEIVWMCLREHRTTPDDESGTERINYDDFVQVAAVCEERVGPKTRRFFTAATFLTFEADDSGRIAILPFYLYVMRWVSITQTRIDMCMLDDDNDGYLRPKEMEAYIRGLVPSLKLLQDLDPNFLPLYCQIATRKFLFFCDPQRRGKLLIREVLLSPVLSELMELRQEPEGEEQLAALQENWFALNSARRIHEMFCALDADGSGGLSKSEVRAFNDDNLTDIFIERVFDLHVRRARGQPGGGRAGEMDLGSFLDLVLALDNKHTPEGLAYIFKCLDLHERGFLTTADVYMLFRSVHKRWMEGGNYELMIEDVKDEVWDMVKPRDPLRITLEDLVECKQGDTVCSMLIDIGSFWAHDNRENLAAQQDPPEPA